MRRRIAATVVAYVIWGAGHLLSQDLGAVAPANCWVTQGGSFAHSGTAATTPVTEHLERRWTWKPEINGDIEGDPLVWQGIGLFAIREGKAARRLVLIDLLDGTKLGEQPFKTELPIVPSLWANFVVVRAAPDRLEAYQLSGRKLTKFEFFKPQTPKLSLSAPIFTGHDVFVRANQDVLRLAFNDSDRPVWKTKIEGANGEIALWGEHVFVASDGDPGMRIVALALGDGNAAAHSGVLSGARFTERCWLEILDRQAILFGVAQGGGRRALMFPRDDSSPAGLTTDDPKRFIPGEEACAISWNRGFLVPVIDSVRGDMLLGWSRGEITAPPSPKFDLEALMKADLTPPGSTVFADAQSHPDFIGARAGLSRAGYAVATSGGILDVASSKIVQTWTSDGRPIPVRGGWLTTKRGGEVTMWRATRTSDATPLPTSAREVAQGRALLINGRIVNAPFTIGPAGVEMPKPAKRSIPWGDVLAVEEVTGAREDVAFTTSHDAAAEARAIAVEAEAGAALAKLARDSIEFGDKRALASTIDAAVSLGADDGPSSDVAAVQRALRNWRTHATDAERSKTLVAQAESRRSAPIAGLATQAKSAATERVDLATALLRQAFARDGRSAEADAVLRSLLPQGLNPPARDARDYAPAEWLDLASGLRRTGAKVIPVPKPDSDVTPEQRILGYVRESVWGKTPAIKESLYGLHVGDVALITRASRPRNVGRCVTASVEICKVLEKLFATEKPRRKDRDPMEVRYYSSQKEFLSVTGTEFGRAQSRMFRDANAEQQKELEKEVARYVKAEFSSVAGVYFPDLSRAAFFEPETDDPLQPVEQVFRHELTHAWLDLRNPRRSKDSSDEHRRNHLTNAGQWCVEGFPTFLQEQVVDPKTSDIVENRGSFTLDFIAHASTLLPWSAVLQVPRAREVQGKLYEAWRADLYQAAMKAGWTEFPNARLKTYVGMHIVFEPIQVFYRQAAATCHYLYFAENGKYRAKLVDYITDFYNGEAPERADFATVFGIEPDDFGEKVVAYAKKAIGG